MKEREEKVPSGTGSIQITIDLPSPLDAARDETHASIRLMGLRSVLGLRTRKQMGFTDLLPLVCSPLDLQSTK